ncbi:hypothetical protein B0H11DRAFT_2204408 [Mycena galericulata]|nr:hypothetical protein B0H11DRAFT_2204408 [Mycena galericulata]
MPILTLHPELLAIGLASRAISVDAASFESFGCQPVAQNGNALQNAHAFPGKDPAVECDYPGAGSCFYDPSGALVTQSASPNCPDSLVQAQLVSQTTTESTTSTAPPSPSSSEVTQAGGGGSTATPGPPSTSSPPAESSTPTTTSTAATGVGSAAGGVSGSATTSILSNTPASPSATGRGALETGTPSENQPHPAVVGGAVAAAIVVIIVFLALLLLWLRRRRRRRRRRQLDNVSGQVLVQESATPHADAVPAAPRSEPFESSAKGSHSYPDSIGTTAGMESEVGVGSTISAGDLDSDAASETLTQRIRRMEAQMEALLARGVADTAPPEYAV